MNIVRFVRHVRFKCVTIVLVNYAKRKQTIHYIAVAREARRLLIYCDISRVFHMFVAIIEFAYFGKNNVDTKRKM